MWYFSIQNARGGREKWSFDCIACLCGLRRLSEIVLEQCYLEMSYVFADCVDSVKLF